MRKGLLAEFETAEGLLAAARALRDKGYSRLDGFTPFPLHGAEEAFGLRRSRLAWVVFLIAMVGASGAYFLQWLTVAYDYPLNVGGRPAHSPPMFVPITFEMGVLFAAFGSLFVLLAWAGLPRLWHPVFEIPGFERSTIDRFWLGVEAADPAFHRDETARLLWQLGALRVVPLPAAATEETSPFGATGPKERP